MTPAEKDPLAAEVTKCWEDFQKCLVPRQAKVPLAEVQGFWGGDEALRRVDEV